ncbi:unnamed protein product [Kuraishia capsulata CBS 1993]|uniref:Mediator of RNA polymerase II transcription subunit 13 n=1 Tax=Kuraishia capsulata CBS 1993 TaxID=1382522 RepID=W6MR73_9ASCO|nr:uncharacterized protein KUCA_T00003721001 [Kuraishia capsulata CBS 1993]CDK27742.1 unnamed protein product [Kuraishia capsulata CBS 1993]
MTFQLSDLNPLFKAPGFLPGWQHPRSLGKNEAKQYTETNFYKFAQIRRVFYFVLQLKDHQQNEKSSTPSSSLGPPETSGESTNGSPTPQLNIYDYESLIRNQLAENYGGKGVLVIASGKDVWVFLMDVAEIEDPAASAQLQSALESLISDGRLPLNMHSVGSFTASEFAQKPNFSMYMNFFKAVRKSIFAKVSASGANAKGYMLPFATQLLIHNISPDSSDDFSVLKMNPSLSLKGELIVNMSMSNFPRFRRLSDLCPGDPVIATDDKVVYLCPSGVRCYFAVNGNCKDSLTEEAPSHLDKHIQLLKEHCDIILPQIPRKKAWVKLVPNLKHLNSLTPMISNFLEKDLARYGSSKYIVWPTCLCFIQTSVDTGQDSAQPNSKFEDPFDVVNDFIDADLEYDAKKEEEGFPVLNPPIADLEMHDFEEDVRMADDSKLWSEDRLEQKSDQESISHDEVSTPSPKGEDWDELFGDMEDEDDPMTNQLPNAAASSPSFSVQLGEEGLGSDMEESRSFEPVSTSLYEDPGAPAPLPLQIFASPSHDYQENRTISEKPESRSVTPNELKKSVFAPLNFNPVIQKSIDSKYSNGGKYFFGSSKTGSDDIEIDDPTTPSFKKFAQSRFGDITPSLQENDDSDLVSDSEYESSDSDSTSDNDVAEEMEVTPESNAGMVGLGINHGSLLSSQEPAISALSAGWTSSQNVNQSPIPGGPVENQNWLPFLLRTIPMYTIPACFMKNNPSISAGLLGSVLPIIQNLLVFGWANYLEDDTELASFDPCFQELMASRYLSSDIDNVMRTSFPGVAPLKLYELLGSSKSQQVKYFDYLTGEYKDSIEYTDQYIPQEFDDPNFATTSPLFNMNTAPESANFAQQASDTQSMLDSVSQSNLFHFPQSMINLKRMDQPLKVSLSGLKFWNLLNLQPLHGKADFRMVIVAPHINGFFADQCKDFFNSVVINYSSCKLGTVHPVEIVKKDDDECLLLSDGVLTIDTEDVNNEAQYWDSVRATLSLLAKSIQLSYLENERNADAQTADETQRLPILLFFADPFGSISSIVEAAKSVSEFADTVSMAVDSQSISDKNALDKQKKKKKSNASTPKTPVIPIVRLPIKVFQKIFPIDFCYSRDGGFSMCTNSILTKMSLSLYNICPSSDHSRDFMRTFTTISKDLPKKIDFKLTRMAIASSLISEDLFIHVAYERSIDKNWCVASWTDQYGSIRNLQSWHVPYESSKNGKGGSSAPFESVSNKMWNITMNYINNHTGKCYVILTRLNNVIPDDELIEWKRLSQKYKNMSLVVLTVDTSSSFLVKVGNANGYCGDPESSDAGFNAGFTGGKLNTNTVGSTSSNTGVTPFKIESPEVYGSMTTPSDFNMLSPSGGNTGKPPGTPGNSETSSIQDVTKEAFGLILNSPLPLSNQPTRIPIKTGYLYNVFPLNSERKDKSSLEVNLLSCPHFSNGPELVKTILFQYRNLSNLSDAWAMSKPHCKFNSMIPWHIMAVKKTLSGIVHIRVQ